MKKLISDFEIDKYGLHARFVTENDAEFILKLRTDKELAKFLNPTSYDIKAQIDWLKEYKIRESQGLEYYFIFSVNHVNIGLERIYNITDKHFTHGSLLFDKNSPFGSSVLADIITREIGFDVLDIPINYFDVRKGNVNVRNFHQKYAPQIIGEDNESFYYSLTRENFTNKKDRILKLFNKL